MAKIELDIFSGRPNPVWELSGPETHHFISVLNKFVPQLGPIPELSLGYRGFTSLAGVQTWRIFRGLFIVDTRLYGSIAPTLEEWLLDTGKATLDPSVYQLARTELGLP